MVLQGLRREEAYAGGFGGFSRFVPEGYPKLFMIGVLGSYAKISYFMGKSAEAS